QAGARCFPLLHGPLLAPLRPFGRRRRRTERRRRGAGPGTAGHRGQQSGGFRPDPPLLRDPGRDEAVGGVTVSRVRELFMNTCAVIPAAGRGTRLGIDLPKLLVPVTEADTIWSVLKDKIKRYVDHIHV